MFRAICAVVAGGLLLAACGSSKTDRALSGGGIGALGGAAGSLILGASPMGGLAGGLLGGAAGAAIGALTSPDENDPSARGRSGPTASPQEPHLRRRRKLVRQ
jgi:osmotically inducible lipoprotein OsmB